MRREREHEGSLAIAVIVLAAAAFMPRFLVALLREGAPSVCWGIVQSVYDL